MLWLSLRFALFGLRFLTLDLAVGCCSGFSGCTFASYGKFAYFLSKNGKGMIVSGLQVIIAKFYFCNLVSLSKRKRSSSSRNTISIWYSRADFNSSSFWFMASLLAGLLLRYSVKLNLNLTIKYLILFFLQIRFA